MPLPESSAAGPELAREWASKFAHALASMTMSEPRPEAVPLGVAPGPPADFEWIRLPFSLAPAAAVIAGASPADWRRLGRIALDAAGLLDSSKADSSEPDSSDEARSTCAELLAQASSGFARLLSQRLGREVTARPAEPLASAALPPGAPQQFSLEAIPFAVFVTPELAAAGETDRPAPPAALPPSALIPAGSRTLDLLMEVEMPVSVSFGRAQLPLRDVLKLNSGSIVELNRTVSEPVEVIVNNCVIARGEVVVVDGNYGVRIQQVISKEERLRTLT